MSGSFRVLRTVIPNATPGDIGAHDHVIFYLSSGKVGRVQRPAAIWRDGSDSGRRLQQHPTLSRLGPEPLSDDFDAAALARACRGKRVSLKAALLDQRVVAGLGNIYASDALHVAGLSPVRRASTIATSAGAPRDAAVRLVAAIKLVLEQAITRQSSRGAYRDSPFLVYDRQGEACPRARCSGTIRRRTQGGRSTFYCPKCQR